MYPPLLRGYQIQTFSSIARGMWNLPNTDFTMMFPRQAGKNQVSGEFVAFLCRLHARVGGSIIVTAPTMHPQATISRERTVSLMLATLARIPGRIGREVIVEGNTIRCGRASATFLSASPTANVAGHTASIALIADEAQDIDQEWFDRQFRPMTASTGAPVLMFGTPWDGDSMLERTAAINRAIDAGNRGGDQHRRHHQVSWQRISELIPQYGEHVRAQRQRLGADSALYLTQYELQTSARVGRLFEPSQLAAITGGHSVLQQPVEGERYVAGLDIGGQTEHADATVLTIARVRADGRAEVVAWLRWQAVNAGQLIDEVAAEARYWQLERLHADATGMGQPVVSLLAEKLGRVVEGVTFSESSKSELGWLMRTAASTGRFALPADNGSPAWALAMDEYATCHSELKAGRRIGWAAPPGEHDDFVASLALCLDAARALGAPRIASGRSRQH